MEAGEVLTNLFIDGQLDVVGTTQLSTTNIGTVLSAAGLNVFGTIDSTGNIRSNVGHCRGEHLVSDSFIQLNYSSLPTLTADHIGFHRTFTCTGGSFDVRSLANFSNFGRGYFLLLIQVTNYGVSATTRNDLEIDVQTNCTVFNPMILENSGNVGTKMIIQGSYYLSSNSTTNQVGASVRNLATPSGDIVAGISSVLIRIA